MLSMTRKMKGFASSGDWKGGDGCLLIVQEYEFVWKLVNGVVMVMVMVE